MKRVKADSWAARLDPEQREELMADYHESRLSCMDAAARASQLAGRQVTAAMFSSWYHTQRGAWLAERARLAAEAAAESVPGDLDARTALALRQARFAAAVEQLSAKEIALLEATEIKRQQLELDRQRLQLDRDKFEEAKRRAAQADATEDVAKDEELTPEAKMARIKEIFGLR